MPNSDFTKKKLDQITDEVRELHPLLKTLFKSIPEIKQYEHTHGPAEYGADFILYQDDPILSLEESIGVVVKAQKISQSSLQEVKRQIDECFTMPRPLSKNRTRGHLNKVWVISSKTISNNARDVITEQYKGRAITFIAQDTLADLLEKHAPHYFDVKASAFSEQITQTLQDIRNQEKNRLPQDKQGNPVYADVLVRAQGNQDYSEHRSEPTTLHKALTKSPRILLEGDMGSGKSFLLIRTFKHLATHAPDNAEREIPILVDLAAEIESGCLRESLSSLINQRYPEDLWEKGFTALLLIDGTEEAAAKLGEDVFNLLLDDIARLSIPGAKFTSVVVTSRPYGLAADRLRTNRNFRIHETEPLSFAQTVTLIQASSNSTLPERTINDLKHSQLFRQLPQSPISAFLLSKVLEEVRNELPSSITELYSQATELMLGRWDHEKGLIQQKYYQAASAVTVDIASYVYNNHLISLSYNECKERLENYLKARNLGIEPLQLEQIVFERSGLFYKGAGGSILSFRHRSFVEYFVALGFIQESTPPEFHQPFYDPERQVHFFYAGLKKECEQFLIAFINQPTHGTHERWQKSLSIPDLMLAAFSTKYSLVKQTLPSVFLELAQSYLDELDKGAEAEFSDLTECQILAVLQYRVRTVLGYRFFEPALEEVFLSIADDTATEKRTKAYALYFASIVARDIGLQNPFDFLLAEFDQGELPSPISLLLPFETIGNGSGTPSSALSRRVKKIRKQLSGKSGAAVSSSLRKVLSSPVKSRTQEKRGKD